MVQSWSHVSAFLVDIRDLLIRAGGFLFSVKQFFLELEPRTREMTA
jgi:hypothetical protein